MRYFRLYDVVEGEEQQGGWLDKSLVVVALLA
jgi:hypothetical protein